jgi:hypothetical protein
MPPAKKKAAAASPAPVAGSSSSSSSSSSSNSSSSTAAAAAPIRWTGKSVAELQALIEQLTVEMHEAAEPTREDYATALEIQGRIQSLKSQLVEAQAAENPQGAGGAVKLEDALQEEPAGMSSPSKAAADRSVSDAAGVVVSDEQEQRLRPWNQPPAAAADPPQATIAELVDKLAHGHLLTRQELERLEQEPDDIPVEPVIMEPAPSPLTPYQPPGGSSWLSWSPFAFFTDKDGDGIDDNTGQTEGQMAEAAAKAKATTKAKEKASAPAGSDWAARLENTVDAALSSGEPVDPASLWEPAPAAVSGSVIDVGAVARYATLVNKVQSDDLPEQASASTPAPAAASSSQPAAGAAAAGAAAGAAEAAVPSVAAGGSSGALPSPVERPTGGADAATPTKKKAAAGAATSKAKATAAVAKKGKPPPKPRSPKPPTPRPKGMPSKEWYMEVLVTGKPPPVAGAPVEVAAVPPSAAPKKKGKKKA